MFNYLEDKNLSLSAKGLLAYMLSKPKNWYFSAQKLEMETNTKRLKLETALNELEFFGYLKRERCRENGRFGKMKFEVFDEPYKVIKKVEKSFYNIGYVYLVKLDKHYKIGISKSPEQRLKEFTKLPYKLETILCEKVNDYEKVEIELHEHFSNKRVRGEWFQLNEADIWYIKKYLNDRN